MPACARRADAGRSTPARRLAGLLAAASITLSACAPPAESGRFEILDVDMHWANGRLAGHCELDLGLSPKAREALRHGVPLIVELELILRNTGDQTRAGSTTLLHEIRYMPLSEHYQVDGPGDGRLATFPRLRHALAELSRPAFDIDTGALPAGEYELLVRSRLDHHSLPPPMRLPALFDPGWKHASGWTSWPLTIEPDR